MDIIPNFAEKKNVLNGRCAERTHSITTLKTKAMATFEVGQKIKVIKPCRTSGNRKGLVGFITEIDESSLDGFGECTIHRVCRQKNCNHKNCRMGKDEGWYEHESGIRLYSPISEGRATNE